MKTKENRRNRLDGPFTAIARAQSRSWKVNIVASGSKLSTDGENIYFPWNSDDIKGVSFQVLNGYLDHEVGHVAEEKEHRSAGRTTPLELLRSEKNKNIAMLLNVYEDIRVESKRSRIYPGVAANLKAVNEHSVETYRKRFSNPEEQANFWHTFGCGIIFAARGLDTSWLPESYKPFMEIVQAEIEESKHVEWAQDSYGLAQRTFEKVHELVEEIEKEKEKTFESKDKGGSGDSKDGDDATAEDGDAKSTEESSEEVGEGDIEVEDTPDSTTGGGDTTDDTSTPSESSDEEDDDSEASCDVEEASKLIESIKEETDTIDILDDGKEEIEKESEGLARKGYVPNPGCLEADTWITPKKGNQSQYGAIKNQVQKQISALKAKLIRVVKSRAIAREQYEKDQGRLDTSSLHQLRLGGKNIFSTVVPGQTLDTAVTVLVDLSGSMGSSAYEGERSYYARMTAVALAETFDSLGVPFEIIGFHNSHSIKYKKVEGYFVNRLPFEYHVYKSFDESHRATRLRLTDITGKHENVDGEAILAVARRLAERPESRKLMFVISDGKPCCPGLYGKGEGHLHEAIKKVRDAGIILFGIGVQHSSIKHFYGEKHSICVNKLDVMAENIFKVVREALLAGFKKVA